MEDIKLNEARALMEAGITVCPQRVANDILVKLVKENNESLIESWKNAEGSIESIITSALLQARRTK